MGLVALESSGIVSPAVQILGAALYSQCLLERVDASSLAQSSATGAQKRLSEGHVWIVYRLMAAAMSRRIKVAKNYIEK